MLHEIFYWILNMSLIAALVGLVVSLLRFLKVIPRFGIYLMWGLVLIRFLCPIGLSSRFSLMNLIAYITGNSFAKTIPSYEISERLKLATTNTIQAAGSYHPLVYKSQILDGLFHAAALIWFIIALLLMILVCFLYLHTKLEVKNAQLLSDHVYECDMAAVPAVYGILHPIIIIPSGIKKDQLSCILAHERIHIKRHDNLWRLIGIFTCCIHWFNPFVWIFLHCFLKDCELACDSGVVKKMNQNERKLYAQTLLELNQSEISLFHSAFQGSIVKQRITNLLTYKKLTIFSTITLITLFLLFTYILLSNAAIK